MTWWCSAQGLPWTWEWRAYPGIWLSVLALTGAYIWALRRWEPRLLARDDRPTTRGEIASFAAGVLVLWVAADWPIGTLAAGYLLSARVLQYLMFVLVAPPLLLLGTPRWLLRRLLRGRAAFRIARLLARPLIPLLVYNTVLVAVHLPPVVDGFSGSQLGSFILDLTVVASGLVFWWPVVGRLPELNPMGYPGRIGYLLLSVFLPTVPASFFTFAQYPIYGLYEFAPPVGGIDTVTDQQIGGMLMKLGGGLVLFGTMSVMFFRWHSAEERAEHKVKEVVT